MEHLPKDCLVRREELSKQVSRISMNNIEVIPSPNNSDAEAERASLNVVIRAQSRCNAEVQTDKTTKQKTKKTQESKESKEKPREKSGEPSKQTQAKDEHKVQRRRICDCW